jgi:hypothetical protein
VELAAFVVLAGRAHGVFELGDQFGERGSEVGAARGVGQVPHFVDRHRQVLDPVFADGGRGR